MGQPKPAAPEDKEFTKAIIAAHSRFDVRAHIKSPDWEMIKEAYMSLTGEDIPAEYTEQPGWGTDLQLVDGVEDAAGAEGAEAGGDAGGETSEAGGAEAGAAGGGECSCPKAWWRAGSVLHRRRQPGSAGRDRRQRRGGRRRICRAVGT